jgi:short-subunit dehydrogenase
MISIARRLIAQLPLGAQEAQMSTTGHDGPKRYGDWAVVTGGSDGIGRAMAEQLAEAGLSLVLTARRRDRLDAVASEITTRYGVECRVVAADLGSAASVDAIVEAAATRDVGILVAAAGFGTSGDFIGNDIAAELNMIDVNCRAVVALAHHFGARFAARGRGGIVLMSSLLAFQGVPKAANYAATKAFIQTFAEGLRVELRQHGVDVIASAPGPVSTSFGARADMQLGRAADPGVVARQTLAALGKTSTVRPGVLAKVLEAALAPLPRSGRVRIMQTIMAGITQHQNETKTGHATRPA